MAHDEEAAELESIVSALSWIWNFRNAVQTQMIERLLTGLARRNGTAIMACYHPDVTFIDPIFPDGLRYSRLQAMYSIRLQDHQDMTLVVDSIETTTNTNEWTVNWSFRTGGMCVPVQSRLEFLDGLIHKHIDSFNLWRFSRSEFGLSGTLLGWSPITIKRIRTQSRARLDSYRRKSTTSEIFRSSSISR